KIARMAAPWAAGSTLVTLGYFAARHLTGAMTPFNAPSYYRFTFAVRDVLENLWQYADRSLTVALMSAVVAVAILGAPTPLTDRGMRALLAAAVAWLVGGFAITVFLPVRSDLYACFPSVGACLASAAVVSRAWSGSLLVRRQRALL